MQVTEVRIKLMEGSEDRLRAFCSITLDHSFVIRDLKVIDGASGPFVAMPSRKLSGHCYRCNYKNHLRAAYCNQCGTKLKAMVPPDSPQKLYADVAHPVNSDCREMISAAVLTELEAELARASQPGYRSRYDDDFEAISESQDEPFPVASAIHRPPGGQPQTDTGGGKVRIDNSHEPPRRSPSDPTPHTFNRQSNPSDLPPDQIAAHTGPPTNPPSTKRGGDPLATKAIVGTTTDNSGYRVDSAATHANKLAAARQQPNRQQPADRSHGDRQPVTSPDRQTEPQPPTSDSGFGAGIFD